jgi:hypothetical protein
VSRLLVAALLAIFVSSTASALDARPKSPPEPRTDRHGFLPHPHGHRK